MFIVRNSWGQEWGDNGYCYIPLQLRDPRRVKRARHLGGRAIEDLDFSAEIESEDDSSYFASEGSIQLFDFYVATESVEEFATALEALCEQHENEDSFTLITKKAKKTASLTRLLPTLTSRLTTLTPSRRTRRTL